MTKKKHKKLNQKKFDLIKMLIENGLSIERTANVVGKSAFTVFHTKKATSLENYFELTRIARSTSPTEIARKKASQDKKVEKKLNGELNKVDVGQLEEIKKILIDTNTVLRRIESTGRGGRRLFGR